MTIIKILLIIAIKCVMIEYLSKHGIHDRDTHDTELKIK